MPPLTAAQPASLHCSWRGTMCLTVHARHMSMPCARQSKRNVVQQAAQHIRKKACKDIMPPLCSSGSTLTMCPITQMTVAGESLNAATDPMSSSHEQLKCVSLRRQQLSCAHLHPSHACHQPLALQLSAPCTVQMVWQRPALFVCRPQTSVPTRSLLVHICPDTLFA